MSHRPLISSPPMIPTPPLSLAIFTPTLPQTPPFCATTPGSIADSDDHQSPPPTPTPSGSRDPTHAFLSAVRIRAVSPPTPAPSPQPYAVRGSFPPIPPPRPPREWSSPERTDSVQRREERERAREDTLVEQMTGQFLGLSTQARQRLLMGLIEVSPPSALSPLLPLITPRLKRDFLKTLPVELAFHVLSFVDDVRTLARASGVSRFWRALLEDEGTWRRMCWRSGFGEAEEDKLLSGGLVSAGQKIRSLEFGARREEEGTPAGRERRGTLDRGSLLEFAARAEHFGLRPGNDRRETIHEELSNAERDRRQFPAFDALTTDAANSWQAFGPDITMPTISQAGASTSAGWPDWGSAGLGFRSGFPHGHRPSSSADARRARAQHRQASDPTSPLPPTPDQPTLPGIASPDREAGFDFGFGQTAQSGSTSAKPFSYKTHFKRAYLTESAWLRGPGRLLSTQMSADDGVVTSLGFDNEWIVVGMATSKVHIFEAATGGYVKTLDGHELGVWCLTLISKGGGLEDGGASKSRTGKGKQSEAPSPPASWDAPTTPTRNRTTPKLSTHEPSTRRGRTADKLFTDDSPTANSRFFRHPRPSDPAPSFSSSSSIPHIPRRRSFHSFDPSPASSSSTNGGIRTGGMGLGAGGETGDSSQQAGVCGTARGWGQPGAIVVTGGCDRDVRVWDVETARCLHVLRGHTSTVRCMRVLDGRPIAVSGSRDATLRVWNIETGQALHLLAGHEHSVRCIEISGNKVVSGSYDATCRLWDVDTGECLFVYSGHVHQIYAVAFDGIRVVTGSLDSTVRIWSATTGEFLALLQGHTSLVGQLQLDPVSNILVTGGSDGRCIVFDLTTYQTIHRLCAHDNSVTCLQFDDRFIVTGGNDGRIKLWDFKTGAFLRELADPCDAVWRVTFRDDKAVILCRREGKTLMDVRTFRPTEAELHGDV